MALLDFIFRRKSPATPATREQRERIARALVEVADGRSAAADVLAQTALWDDISRDKRVDRAHHALHHFRDDEDIREKDADYAAAQIEGLRAWATKLLAD
jgi:hypothetical protein